MNYFLCSDRLGFTHWREDHLRLAISLWGDPKVTGMIDARGQLTEAHIKDRLLKEIRMQKEFSIQYWPIFLLDSGDHVGCCGLRPHQSQRKIHELGFHIRSDCWGHGYAYEAASVVVDYAFSVIGADGLFAGHHPNNTVSRHILEKLGFRHTHDEYYPPTGLSHPSYSLKPENLNQGAKGAQ